MIFYFFTKYFSNGHNNIQVPVGSRFRFRITDLYVCADLDPHLCGQRTDVQSHQLSINRNYSCSHMIRNSSQTVPTVTRKHIELNILNLPGPGCPSRTPGCETWSHNPPSATWSGFLNSGRSYNSEIFLLSKWMWEAYATKILWWQYNSTA